MLIRSKEYQRKCKELCSAEEYLVLEKAFFDKENNLENPMVTPLAKWIWDRKINLVNDFLNELRQDIEY